MPPKLQRKQQTLDMWWIYALLAAFFAALTGLFAKKGLTGVHPDLATAIRTVIILFLAWMIVFFRGHVQGINQLTKSNWIFLILSGLATGMSWIFYFRALQSGKLSQVATLDKLSLVFTIVLAVIFLGDPITWRTVAGALLVVAGSLLLIS